MEQTPQASASEAIPASEQTPPDALPEQTQPDRAQPDQAAVDGTLREELAKWRERVPRLAAALRQRAEEAEVLKQELERVQRVQARDGDVSAGIRARDELIEELEGRVAGLAEEHKQARGELHARGLEVEQLQGELGSWKAKWQSVVRTLDEQASRVDDRDQRASCLESENDGLRRRLAEQVATHEAGQRALDEAVEERDSLRQRNEQLFETTDLANRQIGSLTDSIADLRNSLKQLREREDADRAERDRLSEALDAARTQLEELQETAGHQAEALTAAEQRAGSGDTRVAELEARLQQAQDHGEEAERALSAVIEELHLVSAAAAASMRSDAAADARQVESDRLRVDLELRLRQAEESAAAERAAVAERTAEVARLTQVVERAQRTTEEREGERRELSERLQTVESRADHLEKQLSERSQLVVNLEQDRNTAVQGAQTLQRERDELQESLRRAERNVKESTEYVQQLDSKLERQQQLMLDLEEELAEAKDAQAQAVKEGRTGSADARIEVTRLQEQVRKLEDLVRERTDALNRLEWQRDVTVAQEDTAAPAQETDGRLLMVLNQQLTDERARNQQLLTRVRELEASRQAEQAWADADGAALHDADPERPAAHRESDDLTLIHGVGEKLAEQLNDLGIHHYHQIADLDEAALADEGHALHGHRGRILRDGWIEQAVRLISH